MDITRKTHREAQELILQHKIRQEAMPDEEMIEDKLSQLLAFIAQLERTPDGSAEIQRRVKTFGQCRKIEGESSAEFYAKLRRWLDRTIPRSKPR